MTKSSIQYRPGSGLIFRDAKALPRSVFAKAMDEGLQRGGDLETIAKELHTTVGWLLRHIGNRVKSGKWRFAGKLSIVAENKE